MQSFGNNDGLSERKRRGTEQSEKTLIGIGRRFRDHWNVTAKRAGRLIVELGKSAVRAKRGRQEHECCEQAFFLHVLNSRVHHTSLVVGATDVRKLRPARAARRSLRAAIVVVTAARLR